MDKPTKIQQVPLGLGWIAITVVMVCTMGCSLRLPDSHGGRSGITQLMEAQALDSAMQRIQWRQDLTAQRVHLDVAAAPKESVNPDYLRIVVKNIMADRGIYPMFIPDENEAELQLVILVDSLGTDTYLMRNDNLVTWILSGPLSLLYSVDVNQHSVAQIRVHLYDSETGNTIDRARSLETIYFRRVRFFLGLIPVTFTNLRHRP